ncbi:hypothetical protein ACIG5E_39120 [Kitasatospora sp. NPDC053057]|uniref:hypothetical protein n=1 Tax=Kitasatospora sp. NPDC053057 TaxID=3364062 RepID=UPI0037C9219A
MQPVLVIYAPDGFSLWPVAETESDGYLALSGALGPAEVGTAVKCIAECNDIDPEEDGRPPRPADPLDAFLHGLLTMDGTYASGGLRVTDTTTGTTLLPGCCNGMSEWRDWLRVVDGAGRASFGHDPSPLAERLGDIVRLTVDGGYDVRRWWRGDGRRGEGRWRWWWRGGRATVSTEDDGPVIELPVTELRRLLAGAERDLTDFLQLAADWAARHLPDHATAVTSALAAALDLPAPVAPSA